MILDNDWISVGEVDKLPPLHERCQVLVVKPDGVRLVSMDERSQSGRWRFWGDISGGGWIVAHQPLAAMPTPTPTKPPLVERLLARAACCMTQAMAMEIIGIIDSERAKDAPLSEYDLGTLQRAADKAAGRGEPEDFKALQRCFLRLKAFARTEEKT